MHNGMGKKHAILIGEIALEQYAAAKDLIVANARRIVVEPYVENKQKKAEWEWDSCRGMTPLQRMDCGAQKKKSSRIKNVEEKWYEAELNNDCA